MTTNLNVSIRSRIFPPKSAQLGGGSTTSRAAHVPRRFVNAVRAELGNNPFALPTLVALCCGALALCGIGDPSAAAHAFPFDIPAIFLGLEVFTALVIATGIGDALAVRLALRSKGRPRATLVMSVLVLLATCALGNNLVHVGMILPILLILLSTIPASSRFLIAFFSCVMAVVNLAGASTPVGDFPALTIMASGITSFTNYLVVAFPLFALASSGALLGVYLLILRRSDERPVGDVPPEAGGVLLAAQLSQRKVDRPTLARLLMVLAGMFAAWVFLPAIPPWAIAWSGAALAASLAPRARHAAKMEAADLYPVLRIGTFLAGASYVATTGILEQAARLLQQVHDPLLLLVAMMLMVAAITAVVSAGPTAAVLLPVAQGLVVPGAALAGRGDLVAIAFAGAICAGSSAFLISATAGPLISRRVQNAGMQDRDGVPVAFSARDYLPFGMLNMAVQLSVALAGVLLLYTLGGN